MWRSKPAEYVQHLLGHEGAGSVIAELKKQDFVDNAMGQCALVNFRGGCLHGRIEDATSSEVSELTIKQ
eukprot:1424746-Amphidinium_carterae.1